MGIVWLKKFPSIEILTFENARKIFFSSYLKMISSFEIVTRDLFMQLLLPTFLIHLTRGLTVACLPLYILDVLELSKFDVGIAVGAIGLGKIVMDLPAGLLLDILGSRSLMMLSALLIAISAIGNSLLTRIHVFPGLVFCTFLYGAGQGCGVLSRLAMMSESIDPSIRGRVSALLGGSDRLGMAVGPLLASIAISLGGGIGAVFFLQALCALISGGVTYISIPTRVSPSSTAHVKFCTAGCSERVNIKILFNVSIYVLALQLVREGRKLAIPLAGYDIGLTTDQVAWYSTISFGIDAAMFLVSGSLMDTHGRIFPGSISLSLLIVSLLVLVPGLSPGIILLHAILAGVANGLSAGIVPALGADFAPPSNRSEFLGYYRLFADSGEFLGPFIVGIVSQFTSIPTTMNLVGTLGTVGAFWLCLFVPEPGKAKTSLAPSPAAQIGTPMELK